VYAKVTHAHSWNTLLLQIVPRLNETLTVKATKWTKLRYRHCMACSSCSLRAQERDFCTLVGPTDFHAVCNVLLRLEWLCCIHLTLQRHKARNHDGLHNPALSGSGCLSDRLPTCSEQVWQTTVQGRGPYNCLINPSQPEESSQ